MDNLKKIADDPRYTGIIWLLIRLGLGYQWIQAGWHKVTDPAWTGAEAPAALHKFLTGALEKTSGPNPDVFGWYADWIRAVALPNEGWYSMMVAYGELAVGVLLVLGLFTKWAAFLGAMMNLNYIFAGSTSANGYMLFLETALVFGGLGVAYYGIDRFVMPYLQHFFAPAPPRKSLAARPVR